jgi:hypothetical protein
MDSLRRLLLALLMLGLVVTGSDLLLLEHYEDRLQLVPLALIAAGLVTGGVHVLGKGASSLRVLRYLMVLYLFSGLTGLVLHHRGSRAFQVEVNPGLEGFELFWRAVKAKAPPALAPAAMLHLGLLGLAYGFRHPVLSGSSDDTERRRVE